MPTIRISDELAADLAAVVKSAKTTQDALVRKVRKELEALAIDIRTRIVTILDRLETDAKFTNDESGLPQSP